MPVYLIVLKAVSGIMFNYVFFLGHHIQLCVFNYKSLVDFDSSILPAIDFALHFHTCIVESQSSELFKLLFIQDISTFNIFQCSNLWVPLYT